MITAITQIISQIKQLTQPYFNTINIIKQPLPGITQKSSIKAYFHWGPWARCNWQQTRKYNKLWTYS